ncbi:hypothetical protein [Crocosphaera sp.]|uniref:hypothetical protein n=1 Tax=Crocosphaera sp. TaxID=2729996 RepID=UPI003F22F681|nr:hypothetical protein [Crocosphaera sp.]
MNELKTIILLGILTAILVGIVYGIIGDETGLYIGLTIAAVINFSLWYYCDRLALSIYQAQPLNRRQKKNHFSYGRKALSTG